MCDFAATWHLQRKGPLPVDQEVLDQLNEALKCTLPRLTIHDSLLTRVAHSRENWPELRVYWQERSPSALLLFFRTPISPSSWKKIGEINILLQRHFSFYPISLLGFYWEIRGNVLKAFFRSYARYSMSWPRHYPRALTV